MVSARCFGSVFPTRSLHEGRDWPIWTGDASNGSSPVLLSIQYSRPRTLVWTHRVAKKSYRNLVAWPMRHQSATVSSTDTEGVGPMDIRTLATSEKVQTDASESVDLQQLVSTRAKVMAIPLRSPVPAQCRMLELSDGYLKLQVLDAKGPILRQLGGMSCVALVHISDRAAHIFVARVQREPFFHDRDCFIFVSLEAHPVVAKARQAFRVPITPEAEVEAVIRTQDGGRYGVLLHDISLGGVGGEVLSAGHIDLPTKTVVQVALRCRDISVLLNAEVRHRDGDYYGLFFVDSWRRGLIEPPMEVRLIVRRTESSWIRYGSAKGGSDEW